MFAFIIFLVLVAYIYNLKKVEDKPAFNKRKSNFNKIETFSSPNNRNIHNEIDNTENEEIKIREVKRKLEEEEVEKLKDLDAKADEAYFKCKKIVREILPEMNLVIGEYTFDESKLIFYFTAENRLDFRELVKEVNKTFKKRVEFYQIKQNDEGRILSAFGKYGKEIYW